MAGNLREWCANNFDDQNVNYDIGQKSSAGRVRSITIKISLALPTASTSFHYNDHLINGFRLVVAPALATLTSGTLTSAL
jgi:hypothetical protein